MKSAFKVGLSDSNGVFSGASPICATSLGRATSPNCATSLGRATSPNCATSLGRATSPNCATSLGRATSPNCATSLGGATSPNCATSLGGATSPNCATSLGGATDPNCAASLACATSPNNATSLRSKTSPNCAASLGSTTSPKCNIGQAAHSNNRLCSSQFPRSILLNILHFTSTVSAMSCNISPAFVLSPVCLLCAASARNATSNTKDKGPRTDAVTAAAVVPNLTAARAIPAIL
ncbi:uncharacterized protein LOC132718843 [Ruditapes philippinarum]|uniref:uncharacterized protein LOC132718843 n=1 Tax=Ruditapes philippinarum TaxID=129788 RepID=UPI00295A874F|nr:uncharacterized protein LOC132718843 [Ruditapes philippinarum]